MEIANAVCGLWNIEPGGLGRSSESVKREWRDPEYRARRVDQITSPENRARLSAAAKVRMNTPSRRAHQSTVMKEWASVPENRVLLSVRAAKQFSTSEARQKRAAISRLIMADPVRRKRQSEAIKLWLCNPEVRAHLSARAVERWAAPSARRRWSEAIASNPDWRRKISENVKAAYTSDRKAEASKRLKAVWANPELSAKRGAAISAAHARRRSRKAEEKASLTASTLRIQN